MEVGTRFRTFMKFRNGDSGTCIFNRDTKEYQLQLSTQARIQNLLAPTFFTPGTEQDFSKLMQHFERIGIEVFYL